MSYCQTLPSKFKKWNDFHDVILKAGLGGKPIIAWFDNGRVSSRYELSFIEKQALEELKQRINDRVNPFTADELHSIYNALRQMTHMPEHGLMDKVETLFHNAERGETRQLANEQEMES